MIFHENRLPAWNIIPNLLFLKKAAKFEIVVCCKLLVALYGLIEKDEAKLFYLNSFV